MTVTSNAAEVAAQMRAAADRVAPAVEAVTRDYGLRLQTGVRANMSGRSGVIYPGDEYGPGGEIGPRAQTGDLRRSVALSHTVTPNLIASTAASDAPQAARLEHGFVGVDSLGRVYDQPPYPAWRPALAVLAEPYRDAIGETVVKAMRP